MSIRSLMKYRATIERDTGTQTDPFGGVTPSMTTVHDGDLPCYVQSRRESTVADGEKFVAVVTHSLWAPLGADLQEEDVLTSVVDLRGNVVFPDRLRMLAPVRRETHLEFNLEAYT